MGYIFARQLQILMPELDLIFCFREKDTIMLYRIPHVDNMYVIIVFFYDIIIALPPSSV